MKPKGQVSNFHLNRDAAPTTQFFPLGFAYRSLARHCFTSCVTQVYFRLSTLCDLLGYPHNVRKHPYLTLCNLGT